MPLFETLLDLSTLEMIGLVLIMTAIAVLRVVIICAIEQMPTDYVFALLLFVSVLVYIWIKTAWTPARA